MSVLAVDLDLLDLILDWQMTIAWAGEANCEPSRLGWWRTDLIDELGGVIYWLGCCHAQRYMQDGSLLVRQRSLRIGGLGKEWLILINCERFSFGDLT